MNSPIPFFICIISLFIISCGDLHKNNNVVVVPNSNVDTINKSVDTILSVVITNYKDYLKIKPSLKDYKKLKYLNFKTPDNTLPTDSILSFISHLKSIESISL